MKFPLTLTLLFTLNLSKLSAQQVKPDPALIEEIDTTYKYDQLWRIRYIAYLKLGKKERATFDIKTFDKNWIAADAANELKAKSIINKFGYPGYDIAGKSSDDFWIIIQHCDNDVHFQQHVLGLMKKQMEKNNASKQKYAYLVDRVLTNKNQKQIYGTQLSRDSITGKFSPFPLKYPKKVNQLRKEMGLESLEDYINGFEI